MTLTEQKADIIKYLFFHNKVVTIPIDKEKEKEK